MRRDLAYGSPHEGVPAEEARHFVVVPYDLAETFADVSGGAPGAAFDARVGQCFSEEHRGVVDLRRPRCAGSEAAYAEPSSETVR